VNRIKEVLRQQGRSQKWLADQIDRSYIVVTNYCNNKTQPKVELLYEIAKHLDVDVRELLTPSNKVNGG
jgi:transcriptional regulator with XRE-family HTH domain